jgi:hypothetical protein
MDALSAAAASYPPNTTANVELRLVNDCFSAVIASRSLQMIPVVLSADTP